MIAGSSLDTKTHRSFSALFCRLERNRKLNIEKRKLICGSSMSALSPMRLSGSHDHFREADLN